MGAGGMGGYIGGRLAQAGRNVTFSTRGQHLRAIQNEGLRVQSPDGDLVLNPARSTDNPEEVGPVDLILLCVKSYDVLKAAEKLKPVLGPKTVIVPVQNGIERIKKLGSILGMEHVLGGASLISAQIHAPGSVRHH